MFSVTASNRTKGIVCLISSAFCFALMSTFLRLAGDLPTMEKAFFRNAVSLLIAVGVMLRSKEKFHFQHRNLPLLVLRATAGTVGIMGNFYAVDHLVLSDASMLNKLSPFFAVLFSFLFLKEKLKPLHILTLAGAFVGALCIIKPGLFASGDLSHLVPALAGFAGGLGAGIAYTTVRALGNRGERSTVIVLFFSAFSSLATGIPALFVFRPMTATQLLMLILTGVAAAGGQFTITAAYRFAPAREISVYDYTQILFTAAIGFFLFGQTPDWLSIVGYVLIISMAVIMFLSQRDKKSNS